MTWQIGAWQFDDSSRINGRDLGVKNDDNSSKPSSLGNQDYHMQRKNPLHSSHLSKRLPIDLHGTPPNIREIYSPLYRFQLILVLLKQSAM